MIEPTVDPAMWRAEQKRVSHRLIAAVSVFLVSLFFPLFLVLSQNAARKLALFLRFAFEKNANETIRKIIFVKAELLVGYTV